MLPCILTEKDFLMTAIGGAQSLFSAVTFDPPKKNSSVRGCLSMFVLQYSMSSMSRFPFVPLVALMTSLPVGESSYGEAEVDIMADQYGIQSIEHTQNDDWPSNKRTH